MKELSFERMEEIFGSSDMSIACYWGLPLGGATIVMGLFMRGRMVVDKTVDFMKYCLSN